MQVWFPERKSSVLPSWIQIGIGSFALVTGILMFVLEFHKFGWISQVCLGSWFLLCYPVPRRAESNAREYLTKPRVIGTFILLTGAIVGAVWSLHRMLS